MKHFIKIVQKIIGCAVFLALLGAMLVGLTLFLRPRIPDFYEKDSWDVVFFGTSQTYCTFDPAIFEKRGITSYNRGRQQQTMNLTYYYIKDALEVSDIDVVVLEIFGMFYTGESRFTDMNVIDSTINNFRYSPIRTEMIQNCIPEESQLSYLIPLDKYHGRWDSIDAGFFSEYYPEENSGFYAWTGCESCGYASWDQIWSEKKAGVAEINLEYLKKIAELCQENDVTLVLVKSPFPCYDKVIGQTNTVAEWAEENKIPFVNFMKLTEEIRLDCDTDSLDGGTHLNVYGAEKVSRYLARLLQREYLK